MEFTKLYPDAQSYDCFWNGAKKVIKCSGESKCDICRKMSHFVDFTLVVCVCSEECQEILWKNRDEKGNTKK